MKQKIAYMSVGVIFTVILSFAFLSFASSTSEVTGKLTVIDKERVSLFDGQKSWDFPINPDTIIYRNNKNVDLSALTFDDEVKVLLNSNGEVRYVVATYKDDGNHVPGQTRESVAAVPVSSPTTTTKKDEDLRITPPTKEDQVQNTGSVQSAIRELEVEIEDKAKNKVKLEYETKNGKVESELEIEVNHYKTKSKNDHARVEALIQGMNLTPEMGKKELLDKVKSVIGNNADLRKIKVKVEFTNKKEIEVKWENKQKLYSYKDDDDDDDDHDDD